MSGTHRKTEPETAELQEEIERTRAELADTVDALMTKANVPARARDKAHDTAQNLQAKTERVATEVRDKLPPPARDRVDQAAHVARQNPVPVTAGASLLLLVLIWLARRRAG